MPHSRARIWYGRTLPEKHCVLADCWRLVPVGTPQAHALVALMAFQAARLAARVDAAGELVLLEDQDRSEWDRKLIALGFDHFTPGAAKEPN